MIGVTIVDSHNRWVTIHGTNYLIVRDCVGFQSVGHGFFLEDATEVYNLLDRNLAVQAYSGKRLPIDPRTSKASFSLAAGGAELRWSRTAYLLDTPLLDRLVQLARRDVIISL